VRALSKPAAIHGDSAVRIEVNGVRLFFDVEGCKLVPDVARMREKPTLILLHGGPGFDHSSFRPAFSQYADIAQVIYIDHRGNGRSDREPRDAWTLAQWGDDVFAFCQALEIERPIVMGQSFGGFVAISYATRHPEHPGKLILSSTAAAMHRYVERSVALFEAKGGPDIGAMAREVLTRGYASAETAAQWLANAMPYYNTTDVADADSRRRAVMRTDVLLDFFGPQGECLSFDMLNDLASVRCPTLVLGGEEDPMTPIEAQAAIAAAIDAQWVRFERMPNAGHGAFRDNATVYDIIRDFILT
jgi:proline iminopeptidase